MVAALLSAVALLAWFRLLYAIRTFRRESAAFWNEAGALLETLRDQARQAERHVARTEALLGSAEGIEQTFEGASQFAVRTITHPVVKAMAMGTGARRAWQRFRGIEVPNEDQSTRPRMRVISGES